MEENGSLSKGNVLKSSTNKAIISYKNGDYQESFGELSWPPKSYTCSFCKREFRSAQALGGHMNVHRREKAKLRQINPQRYLSFIHPQSQFLDQNPNPNFTTCLSSNMTSSFPTMFTPFAYSCCLPLSDRSHVLCLSNRAISEAISRKPDEKEDLVVKKLDTGLLVDQPKFDDLDLELRLGCS